MLENLIKWGGWVVAFVIPFVMAFVPARKKEIDGAMKTLVDTLEHSVKALQEDSKIKDEKIKKQDDKIEDLEKHQRENIEEIRKIKSERDGIREILEARDRNTQEFQKQSMESMKMSQETHEMVKGMMEGLTKNNLMTKEFVETMKQHLLNVEKAAIK